MTIGKWHFLLDPKFSHEVIFNNIMVGQTVIEKKEENGEIYGRILNLFTGCECEDEKWMKILNK